MDHNKQNSAPKASKLLINALDIWFLNKKSFGHIWQKKTNSYLMSYSQNSGWKWHFSASCFAWHLECFKVYVPRSKHILANSPMYPYTPEKKNGILRNKNKRKPSWNWYQKWFDVSITQGNLPRENEIGAVAPILSLNWLQASIREAFLLVT